MTAPAWRMTRSPSHAPVVDDGVGVQDAILADGRGGPDVRAGVEDRALADGRRGVDVGLGVDAGERVLAEAVEGDHGLLVGQVRVLGPEQGQAIGGLDLEADDDGRRPGRAKQGRVLLVGQEAELAGAGVLERVDAGDGGRPVADQVGPDRRCQFGERSRFHGGDSTGRRRNDQNPAAGGRALARIGCCCRPACESGEWDAPDPSPHTKAKKRPDGMPASRRPSCLRAFMPSCLRVFV